MIKYIPTIWMDLKVRPDREQTIVIAKVSIGTTYMYACTLTNQVGK